MVLASDIVTFVIGLFMSAAVTSAAKAKAPRVHVHSQRIRVGGRVAQWSDIDRALLMAPGDQSSQLELRLRATAHFEFIVPLRAGTKSVLYKSTRATLLEVLPHTSIEMPEDQFDPTGKFAHYNFPGHITRDEAIAVLVKPPLPGEKLPIPG